MKRKYWAVCYGRVCRWSQAETAAGAVNDAFGVRLVASDASHITVRQFPSNPKYMPLYKRNKFLDDLYARHKEKTGIEIK